MISVVIAYELACPTPITAPVARFSLRMPVVEVKIISTEVRFIASEMPSSIPIIIITRWLNFYISLTENSYGD